MTIPNMITIFRIILIPIFLFVFHYNIENRLFYSGLIFFIAGISDVLDGFVARKFNLTSRLGAMLDPFADKMMSFAVLISFTFANLISIWILIPLIIKELTMISGGIVLYLKQGKAVLPANRFGKIATLSFYTAIASIVFRAPSPISTVLLVITVLLNLIAFYNYLRIFINLCTNNIETVDK